MKKTVPFDLFEEGQSIYFDIMRLAELEKALGDSIINVVRKQDAGINFCIAGLIVGLKHHYNRVSPATMAEKIEKYLDEGGTLDELALPIISAILGSGIFGKPGEERKNVKGTEN
jgi:hypothetical protein